MEEKKYLDFCKVRQVSFRGKYSQQFQNSLQEVVDSLGRASAVVWIWDVISFEYRMVLDNGVDTGF
jgi:hypothetical protein